jgi:hypothetical protein
MSGDSSKTLKKFCSLLTYIEHNNRDLYDTIQDLCLTSIFNTRRGRSVTFLMPDSKSSFHAKIINAAYGQDPGIAVDLIKACTITLHLKDLDAFSNTDGGKLPNELGQELEVDTPGNKQVVLKNGNATIIADTSFRPLYDTSRFGVFVIKSGELNTDNIGVTNKPKTYNSKSDKKMDTFEGAFENYDVSGGAPITENDKEVYTSTSVLVGKILEYDIRSRLSKKPSFLKSSESNVFVAMAVSFLQHMQEKNENKLNSDYVPFLHPNPMCICTMLCNIVDDADYKSWVSKPDTQTDYTYAQYTQFLTKQKPTNEDLVPFIAHITELIKSRKIKEIPSAVIDIYSKKFGENSKSMLAYHESIFLLNSYLRCVLSKDYDGASKYANIYKIYYCANNDPMIVSDSTLNTPLLETAVICKTFEFIRSDVFFYPNKDDRKNILVNGEPTVDFENDVFDHSSLISAVFN